MYFTRTRPMIRDRNAESISSSVAVKAVWRCEGRKTRIMRCQYDADADGVTDIGDGSILQKRSMADGGGRFTIGHTSFRNKVASSA